MRLAMLNLLRYVPKDILSNMAGRLMHKKLPGSLGRWTVRTFARRFKIDVEACELPLDRYASIGQLFTRDLKPGLRPIEGDFVSPVDGLLRSFGIVENGRLEQVKGKTYSLERFLGNDDLASTFDGGIYFNFYLSPRDYHHIHAPVRGKVMRSIHVPGKLWPVNDWSLANIDELFAVNERVITYLKSRFGLVAVVMIGATNVGRMQVIYDDLVTNVPPRRRENRRRDYEYPMLLHAGDRLGTFHMGSSVVILVRKGIVTLDEIAIDAPAAVRYGQALLRQC